MSGPEGAFERSSAEALLATELAAWEALERRPRLWLRDDDAVADGSALQQLMRLGDYHGAPVSLAVIPAEIDASLASAVTAHPAVTVMVHGWAHTDHEIRPVKKAELGCARALEAVVADVARGLERTRDVFGPAMLPVLVPPWNRVRDDLASLLGGLGYSGISTFGRRLFADCGLVEVNTHLDVMDWRPRRGRPVGGLLAELAGHLTTRREGGCLEDAIGVLTHHRVHDQAAWDGLAAIFALLAGKADWISANEAFQGPSN